MGHKLQTINGKYFRDGVVSLPYGHATQFGNMKGAYAIQKFGENGAVAAAEEVIWSESNAYTWMTTGQKVKVASVGANAANDDFTGVVGTGAHIVELDGLDADWARQTEEITLNGVAQVASTKDFIRIFRVKVVQVGSTGYNEGAIEVFDNGGANQVGHVPIGNNQSMQALYTVPAGFRGYMTRVYASSASNQTVEVRIRIREWYNTYQTGQHIDQVKHKIHIFRGFVDEHFDVPIEIEEKSDIYASAIASAAADVSAGFDLLMLDE
jgi:hypothetical protein